MLNLSKSQPAKAETAVEASGNSVKTVDFRTQSSETSAPPPAESAEMPGNPIEGDHLILKELGAMGFQVKIEEYGINGGQNDTNQSNN